jgi:hypothetical protein
MKKQLQQLSMICTFLILSGINLYSFSFQETPAQDNGRKMNFQGTLYENGEPVNGDRSMTFAIELNEETWTETQTVQIIEGLYSVVLGSVTPLPSNLFFGVEERALTVSVGNTTLGTVPLYAPFALNDNQQFGAGDFKLDSKEPEDSVALNAEIFGNGTDLYNMAVRGLARTNSTNTGVAGIATGSPDNTNFQTGVIGNAFSNNKDAWATGTWGTGFSYAGAVTYGMRGEVYGTGATFSAAARALNHMEPGQDGVRYGGYFDTRAGTNSPYSGRSIGVQGTARGSLQNIGVFGSANGPDGTTNWAGWFEGNVALRNGGDLTIYNPSNQLRLDLNYFEANDAGSLVTYGHNNTRRSILGSSSDRSGGLLNLYDSLDRSAVQIRATSRTEPWVTDDNPHGQLKLFGPNSQNIAFGAKVWEEGGADRPTFQMFGTKVDDPNNPGNLVDSEMMFMSVQDNGDGEQGLLQFGKAGAGNVVLNYDNTRKLVDLLEAGKFRFEVNEQNSGVLKLLSEVDSVNVLIDSNGPKAGLIHINDSLGRANIQMLAYKGGGSYFEQSAGIPNIGQTRVTYQLVGNANPWTNMIARNADGTAKGRVQSGWLPNGGEEIGQFRISDGANRSLAQMFANGTQGAQLLLAGPNSSNFWLGGKNWDNSNLPYFAMRGAAAKTDGNGNQYNPDLIVMEINVDQEGKDYGQFQLKSDDRTVINAGVKGWEANGTAKPFFHMTSTYQVTDGNGNTYNPALVNAEINVSNANTFTGNLNLTGSAANTGIRMYGASDFNNDGSDIKAHIALDGTNGNHIFLDGTGNADFTGTVNVVSLNQTSDARLKKNISTLTSGLATINRLRGVRYNWKDESKPQNKIGFIAQEVEEILPELVHTKADGFKAVNYAEMTAVLVEAVKELTAQVEALKAENTNLKAEASKVEAMEDRLAKIEALLGSSEKRTQSTAKK